MYYGTRRERKRIEDIPPRRKKGPRLTFISLAVIGAFLAVTKMTNPDMNIKPLFTMFGGVALACFAMAILSGRNKNDR
jgi:hypothetical protein